MLREAFRSTAVCLCLGLLGVAPALALPETYEFVKEWGGEGCGAGQFGGGDHGPMECTLDDNGYLYVADYGCNRIQRFTASGDPATWGEFIDDWYTGYVYGLEFYDQDGYLYFTNCPGEVGKSTTDGTVVWEEPVDSAAWQTHGIDIDCEGHVRVCENYLSHIDKYDRGGNYLSRWYWPDPVEPNAQEIATDVDGDLWIREGTTIQEFTCQDEPTGRVIDEAPAWIRAVTIDDCGNIYVSVYDSLAPSWKVKKYNPELELLAEWGDEGSGPAQFTSICGICVQGCGDVVVVSDSVHPPVDGREDRMQVFRRVETPAVAFDVKPGSCPNPMSARDRGVVSAAVLGTPDFDVSQIDPASIRLAGVAPLRWSLEDAGSPFEPYLGKAECELDCLEGGPDGWLDLGLTFDAQELLAALGEVADRDCLVVTLTGNLAEEAGGTPIQGEDVVLILDRGRASIEFEVD